jgi:hypothetical protein
MRETTGVRGYAPPLLMTKLHPPPRREQTVARDRLVERLRPRPAQLHGFIERIDDLGLELIAVEQIGEPTRASTERGTE